MKDDNENNLIIGFSLVELSVVLVILGLLTGGILAGQELIDAARLRSQTKQLQDFKVAINTFEMKYFSYPGDMSNAESFWPTATSNGNGDGIIQNNATLVFGGQPYNRHCQEQFNGEGSEFFRQLRIAGIMNGSLAGNAIIGEGIEPLAINQSLGMTVGSQVHRDHLDFEWTDPFPSYGIILCLNVSRPDQIPSIDGSGNFWRATHGEGVMTPETMWRIDNKIDDGLPYTGVYQAHGASYDPELCINNGNYELSETSNSCHAHYILR